jgi:hypothetical protein
MARLRCDQCEHWIDPVIIGDAEAARWLESHVRAVHGATFPRGSKLFVVPPPGAVQSDVAALSVSAEQAAAAGAARACDATIKITFFGSTRAEVIEQARAWLAEMDDEPVQRPGQEVNS